MPNRTYISKQEKTAQGFKAAKDRISLILCSNASGDLVTKPLAIHRALNPRAFKSTTKNQLPVFWRANKKAWMTSILFREWFVKMFVPEVEHYVKKKNLSFKILLIIDNAPCHPADLSHPNVQVIFLPPNTTSLIQPQDQGIISTFKAKFLRLVFEFLLDKMEEDSTLSVSQIWKKYTILHCVNFIGQAIKELQKSTLQGSWKKLWPEGIDSQHNTRDIEIELERVLQMAHSVGEEGFNDMGMDEVNTLLDIDEDLSEEDLLDLLNDNTEETVSEDDIEIEPPHFTSKTIGEAIELAHKLESLITQNDAEIDRSLKFQCSLKNLMAPYVKIQNELCRAKKQPLISSFMKQTQLPRLSAETDYSSDESVITKPSSNRRMLIDSESD